MSTQLFKRITAEIGLPLRHSLSEAIAASLENDKLLMIYFHDPHSEENNFLNLLTNKDINNLFQSNFILCILTFDELEEEFMSIFNEKPENVANHLYTIAVQDQGVQKISTINVCKTSQEDMLYELYLVQSSFQEHIIKENDQAVDENARMYLDLFYWIDKNEYKYLPLKEALDMAMSQSVIHLRKVLMIYMYKEGSALSKQFNYFLKCDVLKKFNPLIIPIFWNITDKRYHKALKFACQRYFDQELLEETVYSDEGGVFFFMPDERGTSSTPRIFTKITSVDTYEDISEMIDALDYIFTDFQRINEITDLIEIEAINTYKRNSRANMEKYIETCSLHDITEMCLSVPRKILMLNFFMPGSKFETTLPKIQPILHREQVIFLPWDISNPGNNIKLICSLNRTFGLKKIEMILEARKSALFLFLPIGNTLVLHSVLQESASVSEITKAYKAAHKFFILESELHEELAKESGPAAYQQVMCNQMGDRNFDCFQLDKNEGESLRKKIAFAYYGPPCNKEEKYDEKQQKQIDKAFEKIKSEASNFGESEHILYISFMRVCVTPLPEEKHKKLEKDPTYQPALDFSALPLFGIRKCFDCPKGKTPCMKYVDHVGRIYETWEDFLENNKYPAVMLIAPKNGKYYCDYRDHVQLEVCLSPACGIGVAVLKGFDIGVGILGGVAAAVGIAATTVVAVPFLPIVAMGTGIGVGVYSIVRSSMTIHERLKYRESMSLSEAEARGAYINILAGSLGFTAAGAGFALSFAAKSGMDIGLGARAVMNGITIANVTAGSVAIGNSAYDVISQWVDDGRPNALALVQLSASILFFGHAVYNTQSAATMIQNSQQSVLSDILDSLSSNRQRKTFLRLLNSTEAPAGTISARAEVIRYMQKLDNVNEVIGILTRDTKLMSKNGVRYKIQNEKIVFNGFEMDVNEFGNLSKVQRNEVLASMPADSSAANHSPVKVAKSNAITVEKCLNLYRTVQTATPLIRLMFDPDIAMNEKINALIQRFQPYVQHELIVILGNFLENMGYSKNDLFLSLSSLFPRAEIPLRVMNIIVQFYWGGLRDLQPEWSKIMSDMAITLIEKAIVRSTCSMAELIIKLTAYCSKWVMNEIIRRQASQDASDIRAPRMKKSCETCSGKRYQQT